MEVETIVTAISDNALLLPILYFVRRICKELDRIKDSVKRLENLHLK
jgi:hypothetical protein